MFAMVVLFFARFATPSRFAGIGAAGAVACAAVSTVPAVHATRWYDVLVGLAFAGAGVVIAGLWPIAQA